MRTAPYTLQDLDHLAELAPADHEGMLARLRWHLATPYALVLKTVFGEALTTGLAMGTRHAGSGWVGGQLMMPHFAGPGLRGQLLDAVVAHLQAGGCRTVTAMATDAELELYASRGFVHEADYLCHAGGLPDQPTADEVVLAGPEHGLGLLHLDRKASGEDRRILLMEHLYAGRLYVEKHMVRGCYLPLLGDGLVLADRPDVGEELLRWHLPYTNAIWLPGSNRTAMDFLAQCGYTVRDSRNRMRLGPPLPWRPELVYGWIGEHFG